MPEVRLRCIFAEVDGGEPDGIVWSELPRRKLTRQWFGQQVCSHLDDLEDGDSITITYHRHDMTKQALDALPEV